MIRVYRLGRQACWPSDLRVLAVKIEFSICSQHDGLCFESGSLGVLHYCREAQNMKDRETDQACDQENAATVTTDVARSLASVRFV